MGEGTGGLLIRGDAFDIERRELIMVDGPSETLFPLQPRDLKRSGNCLLEDHLRLQVENIYIHHVISIFSEFENKYISIDRLPYSQSVISIKIRGYGN